MKISRICILIRTLNKGGAEKQSVLLAKVLNNEYDVCLVVQKGRYVDASYHKFIKENSIKALFLNGNLFNRLFLFYRFLRKNKIQIIFSYLTSDNLISALIGRLAGVCYLAGGIRNQYLPVYKRIANLVFLRLFLNCIILNSRSGLENFVNRGFPVSKLLVINNCIEINHPFRHRKESYTPVILTAGRFVDQKDYLTAIRSFYHLKYNLLPENIKPELIITGFGEIENEIISWIEEYKLSGCARIINNPPNIEEYFLNADIYLSTSIFEGLSNSIMEAMSFSLPVVATDAGDNRLLIRNEVSGFIVPVKAHTEIATKLYELLSSYEKRIAFGKAGYEIVRTGYSPERFYENYRSFINSLSH
jgi:glycosyltransferase involved in cell wall biosynthesis